MTETRIGAYVIRSTAGGHSLYLARTNEHLRTFPSRDSAINAARRYERMTANLSV